MNLSLCFGCCADAVFFGVSLLIEPNTYNDNELASATVHSRRRSGRSTIFRTAEGRMSNFWLVSLNFNILARGLPLSRLNENSTKLQQQTLLLASKQTLICLFVNITFTPWYCSEVLFLQTFRFIEYCTYDRVPGTYKLHLYHSDLRTRPRSMRWKWNRTTKNIFFRFGVVTDEVFYLCRINWWIIDARDVNTN